MNPIENIVWLDAGTLIANDYNPNHVLSEELELIKFSILKNGWIQPILITKENVIIDGFHRTTLAKINNWKVPCCVIDVSEEERMLLTIRINRAKGTHIAYKMSDIVKKLIGKHKMDKKYLAQAIGASIREIDLLLQEDVFQKLKIKDHVYSKAWEVKK